MTLRPVIFIVLFLLYSNLFAQNRFTVLIDPGHGGSNKGAVYGNLEEHELTLSIALKLKNLLAGKNINAVLTRTSDKEVPLKQRAELIESVKPDLFISIHFNSQSFLTTNRGFEIYYPGDDLSSDSGKMIKDYHRANCSFHYGSIFKELYLKSALFNTYKMSFNMFTQKHDLLIFDATTAPGLLLEAGYLTSPDDRACIENSGFINDMSQLIYEVLVKSSQERCR